MAMYHRILLVLYYIFFTSSSWGIDFNKNDIIDDFFARSFDFKEELFLTDIILSTNDGEKIPCHRLFLAMASPVLENLFRSQLCVENKSNEISLPYSNNAINFLLNCIYNKKIDEEIYIKELNEIYDMFKFLGNSSLKKYLYHCDAVLEENNFLSEMEKIIEYHNVELIQKIFTGDQNTIVKDITSSIYNIISYHDNGHIAFSNDGEHCVISPGNYGPVVPVVYGHNKSIALTECEKYDIKRCRIINLDNIKHVVAVGYNNTYLLNLATGNKVAVFPGSSKFFTTSYDGNLLVLGNVIYNIKNTAANIILGQDYKKNGFCLFSKDNKKLAYFMPDGIHIINAINGSMISVISPESGHMSSDCGDFNNDNNCIVVGDRSGIIWVIDIITGNEVAKHIEDRAISSIIYAPNGNYIIVGLKNGNIKIFDSSLSRLISSLINDDVNRPVYDLMLTNTHKLCYGMRNDIYAHNRNIVPFYKIKALPPWLWIDYEALLKSPNAKLWLETKYIFCDYINSDYYADIINQTDEVKYYNFLLHGYKVINNFSEVLLKIIDENEDILWFLANFFDINKDIAKEFLINK